MFSSIAAILATVSLSKFYFHDEQPMRLNINYYNITSEVLSFLQKYDQKMIAHNGDNYIMSITILRDFYMKENSFYAVMNVCGK